MRGSNLRIMNEPKHVHDITVVGAGCMPGFSLGKIARPPLNVNSIMWIERVKVTELGQYIERTYKDFCLCYGWEGVACYISVIYSDFVGGRLNVDGYMCPIALVVANKDGLMVQTDPEVLRRLPQTCSQHGLKLKVVKKDYDPGRKRPPITSKLLQW